MVIYLKGEFMKKEREITYDILKIFACLAVILIHVLMYTMKSEVDLLTPRWQIANLLNATVRFCVPIFVMISGAFLLSKEKPIPLKTLFKKYILKTFLIVILASFFYRIIDSIFITGTEMNFEYLKDAFFRSITGNGKFHLWYLVMLIPLYFFYPMLDKYVRNSSRKEIKYLLIVLLIFSIIIPTLNMIINVNQIILPYRELFLISAYLFYFLFGYYIYKYDFKKRTKIISIILVPVGMLLIAISIYLSSRARGTLYIFFENNECFFVLLSSWGIFMLFKYYISKIKFNNKFKKIVSYLSSCVFGIYVIHVIIVELFVKHSLISFNRIREIAITPLYAVLIFIISLIIISATNGIKFLFTYLVRKFKSL